MPDDLTLSPSPAAVALPPSAAVSVQRRWTASVWGTCYLWSGLHSAPPMPSVRSACTLILPIWGPTSYLLVVAGMDANDYVTSPTFVLLSTSNQTVETGALVMTC